ncbi:MAG: RecB family exonuclease [Acidimicrobiales bacterium]
MSLTLPRSLSPSKVSSFTDCPLAFRLAYVDGLPQLPSPAALKGTLVHAALEALIWDHPAGGRTRAAATAELDAAWLALRNDPEFAALGLDEDGARAFRDDAEVLVGNYFELEDPDRVRAVGVELGVQAELAHVRLRGIIDRLDVNDAGELVVVDYKTGSAPGPRHERGRLTGVYLYALLCEQVLGRRPAEVRLLYLRTPTAITAVPSEQTLEGQQRRTVAVWRAIEQACDRGDFRPRASGLCRFCSFQAYCPLYGGTPPGPGSLGP